MEDTDKLVKDLKNCPCCQSNSTRIVNNLVNFKPVYSVTCTKCNAMGNYAETIEDAYDNWNNKKFSFLCPACNKYYAFSYKIPDNTGKDTFYIRCLNCGEATETFSSFEEAMIVWQMLENKVKARNKIEYHDRHNKNISDDSNNKEIVFSPRIVSSIQKEERKPFTEFIHDFFSHRNFYHELYCSTKSFDNEATQLLIQTILKYGKTLKFSPELEIFEYKGIFKALYLSTNDGTIIFYLYQYENLIEKDENNFINYLISI